MDLNVGQLRSTSKND